MVTVSHATEIRVNLKKGVPTSFPFTMRAEIQGSLPAWYTGNLSFQLVGEKNLGAGPGQGKAIFTLGIPNDTSLIDSHL